MSLKLVLSHRHVYLMQVRRIKFRLALTTMFYVTRHEGSQSRLMAMRPVVDTDTNDSALPTDCRKRSVSLANRDLVSLWPSCPTSAASVLLLRCGDYLHTLMGTCLVCVKGRLSCTVCYKF
jgi:hypothetical protein